MITNGVEEEHRRATTSHWQQTHVKACSSIHSINQTTIPTSNVSLCLPTISILSTWEQSAFRFLFIDALFVLLRYLSYSLFPLPAKKKTSSQGQPALIKESWKFWRVALAKGKQREISWKGAVAMAQCKRAASTKSMLADHQQVLKRTLMPRTSEGTPCIRTDRHRLTYCVCARERDLNLFAILSLLGKLIDYLMFNKIYIAYIFTYLTLLNSILY